MRVRVAGLGAVSGVVGALFACSPLFEEFCPNGVLPFDGETAVPLDTVVVLQTGEAVPWDAPDLTDTVTFETDDGEPVAFHLEIRPGGELRVIPDEPLRPDTTYRVGAVDWYAMGEVPHWWGPSTWGRDYAVTSFTTGTAPVLEKALSVGDGATLVLAFSEAVDPELFDGALTASASAETTGEPWPVFDVAVLGHFEGHENLLWVEPIGVQSDLSAGRLRLAEGLVSSAGGELDAASSAIDLPPAGSERDSLLDRFTGAPYCTLTF